MGHLHALKPAPLPQSGRSGRSSRKKGGAAAPRPRHPRGKLWAWSRGAFPHVHPGWQRAGAAAAESRARPTAAALTWLFPSLCQGRR